ncbi:TonB-dependent receptor [Marilutibacter maris]|uniref:TonB-dependent receptor plug n=1 Tax=Marilutibacter maris TaxID=1605891 RepID=A0A2U9T4L9_9GAMM|nr:TonB-dependent receptor [Lysobacter maris]AWV07676.1 TonB-dependent receptor plug [Lysobacter maris]
MPRLSLRRAPLAVALVSALAGPAHADDAGGVQATTLDRVEVTGQALPNDGRASGATALDVSIQQTPAAVTVVGRDLLDARDVRSTAEALRAVPGLDAVAPPGNGNAVSYRGFSGSQVSQLFNGIDVRYATIAARPVDAWIYERVEAVGGASTFLHGAGAVGGSINYVTRVADLDEDRAEAKAGYASHDSMLLAAGGNRVLDDGRQAVRGDISWSDSDGWVDRNDRESLTSALSWAARLGGRVTHTLALEYQKEDSARVYWGTPALLDDGRLRVLPGSETRNYNVGDGYYKQQVLWARSMLDWQLSGRSRLRNTVYHYDALRDYRNVECYRYNDDLSAVIRSCGLLQRHDQQVYGNRLDWRWDGELGGRASQWAAGLDLNYNRQTRFPQSLSGDLDVVPVDASTPGRYFDFPGAAQRFVPQRTNRVRGQALFVENLTALGERWSLMSALRQEWIQLDLENHQAAGASNPARHSHHYRALTGRLALDYAFAPGFNAYLQLATAADPPSGVLSTASYSAVRDFDLTTGRQAELGAKSRSADGRYWGTLAVYDLVRENLSTPDPDRAGDTLPVGQQSGTGVELTFGLRPVQGLTVEGNLGWVDASLDDFHENVGGVPVSRAGNTPRNTPEKVANLWVEHAFAPGWSAGVDLRAVSARYADNANTIRSAGYALYGANLKWQWSPRTTVTLRARNLADRTWIAYANNANMVYLGEPRSLEFSVHTRF